LEKAGRGLKKALIINNLLNYPPPFQIKNFHISDHLNLLLFQENCFGYMPGSSFFIDFHGIYAITPRLASGFRSFQWLNPDTKHKRVHCKLSHSTNRAGFKNIGMYTSFPRWREAPPRD